MILRAVFLWIVSGGILAVAGAEDAKKLRQAIGPFVKPLKQAVPAVGGNRDVVALGRALFYDARISGSTKISCNDCHDLSRFGTGGDVAVARREKGALQRDVPSVYNKAGLFLFDWDGRYKTIVDKTTDSLLGKDELDGGSKEAVVARLRAVSGYVGLFDNAFPDADKALTFDHVVSALVAFQQGLVTPAPIDAFISGDDTVLTAEQIKGGFLFDEHNCSSCHTGTTFGGQMLQKVGVTMPWPNQKDLGHYYVSKNAAHKLVFRVPSLRNVAETAPYFHGASSRRLWDAIRKMGRHETGRQIGVEEVLSIQEYLKSFTGKPDPQYIRKPDLPR